MTISIYGKYQMTELTEIDQQLTDILATINKMKDVQGLISGWKINLDDTAKLIQAQLLIDVNTINEIERRKHTHPALDDAIKLNASQLSINSQVDQYLNFLPDYQEMVQQLIGNKNGIKGKLEEKKQAGEKVLSEKDTDDNLENAANELRKAINANPKLQSGYASTKSFIDTVRPYVVPLIQAAKIVLGILAL